MCDIIIIFSFNTTFRDVVNFFLHGALLDCCCCCNSCRRSLIVIVFVCKRSLSTFVFFIFVTFYVCVCVWVPVLAFSRAYTHTQTYTKSFVLVVLYIFYIFRFLNRDIRRFGSRVLSLYNAVNFAVVVSSLLLEKPKFELVLRVMCF